MTIYALKPEHWNKKPSKLDPIVENFNINYFFGHDSYKCLFYEVKCPIYNISILEIGLQCDDCQLWTHLKCTGLFDDQYSRPSKSEKR